MKNFTRIPFLLLAIFLSSAYAEDRLDLDGTSIIGNRELPKVLYIAPWKRAQMSEFGKPLDNSLLNEVMAPLERREFQREIEYYYILSDQTK